MKKNQVILALEAGLERFKSDLQGVEVE